MHDSGELKCVFTQLPGSSAKKVSYDALCRRNPWSAKRISPAKHPIVRIVVRKKRQANADLCFSKPAEKKEKKKKKAPAKTKYT
jgi:hypothetical protein